MSDRDRVLKGEQIDLVAAVTEIVRKADRDFERVGGSSRHWVRDCFLPALNAGGFLVVRQAGLPPYPAICRYCNEEVRLMDGEWCDRETHTICPETVGKKHEPAAALTCDQGEAEVRALRAERDRWQAGVEAWKSMYYSGKPMTPAEHDPAKHARTCQRLVPEDDVVIRNFCGEYVYTPSDPCTCGADPNWKERATTAEAELSALRATLARVREMLASRRNHQAKITEAAFVLYKRFITATHQDPDVMDVWSLAVIDPEPPTEAEIEAVRLARPAQPVKPDEDGDV